MIRIVFYTALSVSVLASCNNQNQQSEQSLVAEATEQVENVEELDTEKAGKIEFMEPEFNFGTIKEGEVVEHVFKFENTGNAPVILTQVSATCGCTTPNYTREPVLPGKEGEISVTFDSEGQGGTQQKIITVSSNAENRVATVQLRGMVENR